MEMRRLGRTDMEVSLICLGTMTWGEQNTQDEGFEQMDYALERGINFFDTAELYAVPPKAETYGKTEEVIGNWFAARKNRDAVILATKVAGPAPHLPWIRDGKAGFDRANIEAALDASLKRLQTDYVDLYQLHWPQRKVNSFGRLDFDPHSIDAKTVDNMLETLRVLDDLVTAGKIRAVGLSNETPWGAMTFLRLAEEHGLPRMASIQNPYNLLNRSFEIGLSEVALHEECGLLAYAPMAAGTLSGKYLDGQMPEGSRRAVDTKRKSRYDKPRGEDATRSYVELADKYGLDPAQMALAFVNTRPFLTSNIIGATTMEQLKTDIDALDVELPEELLEDLQAVHKDNPNPCP